MVLKYRLEVNEPLPYEIKVKLAIRGTCRIEGKEYEFWGERSRTMKADRFIYQTSWSEHNIYYYLPEPRPFDYHNENSPHTRVKNLTLEILPWLETGDNPYNVGNPSHFTIKR